MSWPQSHFLPRALALAILAVVIAVPLYLCLTLVAGFADAVSAETDDTRRQIADFTVVAQRSAIAEANLRRIKQAYGKLPYLLTGSSPSAAMANLQDEVKALLEQNGGTIASAEALPPERDGGLERITIRYSMTLPAASMPAFVSGLEAHLPFLFADDLKIAAADGNAGASLTLELNLAGYCKVG